MLLVVHESDLPKGRGFAPLQWGVLEGKNEITACLLDVNEEVDTGQIYDKVTASLDGTELYDELRDKQAEITFRLINRFLENRDGHNPLKQVGTPTYYRKRNPEDSRLDIDKTIRQQFNLLRVCNNEGWPAFFELYGQTYIIKIHKKVE